MATSKTTNNGNNKGNDGGNAAMAPGLSEEGGASMPVFHGLTVSNKESFRLYHIEVDANGTQGMEFVNFVKPTDVITSRWYPGYRVTDLTGPHAEEAIGLMLAQELQTLDSLAMFKVALSNADVSLEVATKLFPRAGVPVKNRKYQISENEVRKVVSEIMAQRGMNNLSIVAAMSHAYVRVLSAMSMVQAGPEQKIVATAKSFAVGREDLATVIMVEAMRTVFSDARIQVAVRELNEEATPLIIGETMGRMFRDISRVIPEIQLRMVQLEAVEDLVRLKLLAPTRLPLSMQAYPALDTLAEMANFMVSYRERKISLSVPTMEIAELKEAVNNILSAIQSAPSIEIMPLAKYRQFFGEVPAAPQTGLRRGIVAYMLNGQTSKMDVADVRPRANAIELSLVGPEYVKPAGIVGPLNGSVLNADAMHGLANIVADEMAMTTTTRAADCSFIPMLATIQISPADLLFLALAKADYVAYVQTGDTVAGVMPGLLFGCNVAEQWRMAVTAATPVTAYFMQPEAVVVYKSDLRSLVPTPLPSRQQTISLPMGRDEVYLGGVDKYLIRSIEKPFTSSISVQTIDGKVVVLELDFMVLRTLLGFTEKEAAAGLDRGGAYYAAVAEPGVDHELRMMFKIAAAYAEHSDGTLLADFAKTWVVEHLTPLMIHPSIAGLAETALNRAIVRMGLDTRPLAPYYKDLIVRAYFAALMAVLARFNKIDGTTAVVLSDKLPISNVSTKAQLNLANMPSQLNAHFIGQ